MVDSVADAAEEGTVPENLYFGSGQLRDSCIGSIRNSKGCSIGMRRKLRPEHVR